MRIYPTQIHPKCIPLCAHIRGRNMAAAEEVNFSPFEQLFDRELEAVLINIFKRLDPPDYDSCVLVCRDWCAFIGRNLICGDDKKTRDMVYAKKVKSHS